MFETLFGSEIPLAARFFIAFLVVLGLIGVTAWLVRRFGANRLGGGATRGRQPRLAVIDAATIDGRRRLVLIRRDNVEHLLMLGGPTDVVVEQNIVRAAGARDTGRPGVTEPGARTTPPLETAWPLQPVNEPPPVAPVATPRYRSNATDEPWLPPEPGARPRPSDSLTGMASEFSTKVNTPEYVPPPVRHEPPHAVPPSPAAPSAAQSNEQNLADMAHQLEAALRRAPAPEHRPPVTDPLAMPAPPVREFKPRVEPKAETRFEPRPDVNPEPRFEQRFEPKAETRFEPKVELKPEIKIEPKLEAKFDTRPERASAPKVEPPKPEPAERSLYDNLEEEMASLLGRPPGKT